MVLSKSPGLASSTNGSSCSGPPGDRDDCGGHGDEAVDDEVVDDGVLLNESEEADPVFLSSLLEDAVLKSCEYLTRNDW